MTHWLDDTARPPNWLELEQEACQHNSKCHPFISSHHCKNELILSTLQLKTNNIHILIRNLYFMLCPVQEREGINLNL